MGTQSMWSFSDIQGVKVNKLEHKLSLVTPRMDVDVTGVSLKNVRTHIIDHPRDEGRKHREQLWNFQQKYRGAIGKLRNLPSLNAEDSRNEDTIPDNITEEDVNVPRSRSVVNDKISLQSRVKRRLSQKTNIVRMKSTDLDSGKGKRSQEPLDEDVRTPSSVRRQYSSGFMVKNSLYNQLRNIDNEANKHRPDDSRILEAIQKFGSLERLPDIPYMGGHTQTPIRFLKTLNGYSRRLAEIPLERRLSSLQRSNTHISTRLNRRKLLIVSRRGHKERVVPFDCLDSSCDSDDEDEDNDEDDGDNDDEFDECENGKQEDKPAKPPNKLRIDHQIRSNITQINTQDDMALLQRVLNTPDADGEGFRTERTFHGDGRHATRLPRVETVKLCKSNSVGNLTTAGSSNEVSQSEPQRLNFKKPTDASDNGANKDKEKDTDKNNNEAVNSKSSKETNSNGKTVAKAQKGNKKSGKVDGKYEQGDVRDSEDSLDIPEDRFGHTTHTIDKKLAIRKPWEWRPSPYRWIDKAYVRESDKPYIERILNKGEVIDEYNYDSFARTKPLKLQNYPENAGYKDRNGVMR